MKGIFNVRDAQLTARKTIRQCSQSTPCFLAASFNMPPSEKYNYNNQTIPSTWEDGDMTAQYGPSPPLLKPRKRTNLIECFVIQIPLQNSRKTSNPNSLCIPSFSLLTIKPEFCNLIVSFVSQLGNFSLPFVCP